MSSIEPLLEQLGRTGTVDTGLRKQAAAASQRLRVLFDQSSDTFSHPVMQGLRAMMDRTHNRLAEITVEASGRLPHLGADEVQGVLEPVRVALDLDMTHARIVVSAAPEMLTVSVLCRDVANPEAATAHLRDQRSTTLSIARNTVWVTVEHPDREWTPPR